MELHLLSKFGEQLTKEIFLLIKSLSGKDAYINNYLLLSLQNILPLDIQEAAYFSKLAHELASASVFAPVLLLEKIPTLSFYGLTKEVGDFLSNIKDYGARAVALFLGSDQLKTEDILDVLEQSTLSFYRALLEAVNTRHQEFGVCCALIMRSSAKIEKAIGIQEIDTYLDICSNLIQNYGTKMTEQYIRNAHDFIPLVPLNNHLSTIDGLAKKSLVYAEFALTYPNIILGAASNSEAKVIDIQKASPEDIRGIKLTILKTEDYLTFLDNSFLYLDKDLLSLMMHWPNLSAPIKANILFQLEKENYKHYIATNIDIESERNLVNQETNSNWLSSWTYCGEIVDLTFIRKKMGIFLQDQQKFSLPAKSIVKKHDTIFDRSNTEYSCDRVSSMIDILLTYCIDATTKTELSAMAEFVLGNRNPLKDILSKSTLVIQAWERDPWVDYGRSDELFSCTSLGDYNAGNAPGFLADLNLNNLDIWSNGARVGRIHLCLIKGDANNTILLLDCVDGTERIIGSKKKFELIMAAVTEYARWLGIEKIKINYDIDYNNTPKKFISYVEHALKGQDQIDFVSRFLTVSTSKWLIPYPCQTFTESFVKNNGAFVRGSLTVL